MAQTQNQNQNLFTPEMPPEIREFLENLLNEAKLQKTDAVLKEMMLSDLYERLQHHTLLVMAKVLTDDQMETYLKLAAHSQREAINFVNEVQPEMPKILREAAADFKKLFLKQK